jgi:type IV pilus assembly protein PilO
MILSEINWDIRVAGTWPAPVKNFVIILAYVIVLAVGIYFDTLDQLNVINSAKNRETTLKNEFETKQKKASNLQEYQNQLSQIEDSLAEMIRQMPTEEELAGLLVDISQTGLASGLQFKLFKPDSPILKDFYSELPINIQVIGKYQELGLFVSGLASLSRIVTLHNITITPDGTIGNLLMTATIKTYNEGGANSSISTANKKRVTKK